MREILTDVLQHAMKFDGIEFVSQSTAGFDKQIRRELPGGFIFSENGGECPVLLVSQAAPRTLAQVGLQTCSLTVFQLFVKREDNLLLIFLTGHTFPNCALSFCVARNR